MIINEHYKFIFIHVPKTAGTTLHFFLKDLEGSKEYWGHGDGYDLAHITISQLPICIPPLQIPNYYIFCFVRNPYDRIYSAYQFLREQINWQKDFYSFVKEIICTDKRQTLIHLAPMVNFIKNNDFKPQYIGRLESYNQDLEKIFQQLNITQKPINNLNVTTDINQNYIHNYCYFTIHIINKIYAEDFQVFGYEKLNPNNFPNKQKFKKLLTHKINNKRKIL